MGSNCSKKWFKKSHKVTISTTAFRTSKDYFNFELGKLSLTSLLMRIAGPKNTIDKLHYGSGKTVSCFLRGCLGVHTDYVLCTGWPDKTSAVRVLPCKNSRKQENEQQETADKFINKVGFQCTNCSHSHGNLEKYIM